jgi:hypothetical protein
MASGSVDVRIDLPLSPADAMAQVEKDQDQAAYREGLFVRALGRPLDSNPYPPKSEDGLLWEDGWRLIDRRRDRITRFDAAAPAKAVLELRLEPPADPAQGQGPPKPASPRRFYLVYLAFCVAFGGLFIMMLMNSARLTP